MDKNYDRVPVIIPALNPDNRIFTFIDALKDCGFSTFVVVDDGSDREHKNDIFTRLMECEITVLTEDDNHGKGKALKEGMSYVYDNMPDAYGVVTADYDGRQSAESVMLVADKLLEGNPFVLGARDIQGSNITKGMRRGYKLTKLVFKLLYNKKIKDIQTGLRAVERSLIPTFIEVKGSRYEYEPKMIIEAVRNDIPISEVDVGPIEPINMGEDAIRVSKNYRPFYDSFRISVVLFLNFLEYALSSITATLVDFVLFFILSEYVFSSLELNMCVLLSTVCARAVSSTISFLINRKVVFKSNNDFLKTIVMFYVLTIIIMLCSAELVTIFVQLFGGNKTVTKLFVDLCLFFLSYQIQQRVIFKKK